MSTRSIITVPHTTWQVEMPTNGGAYHRTVASLWVTHLINKVPLKEELKHHISSAQLSNPHPISTSDSVDDGDAFIEESVRHSLEGSIGQVTLISNKHEKNLEHYLVALNKKLCTYFKSTLLNHKAICFWTAIHVKYDHPSKDSKKMSPVILHSGKQVLTCAEILPQQLDEVMKILRQRNANFNQLNSGLILDEILRTDVKVVDYLPLMGLKFRELPPFLSKKRAIINVQNTDNRCFGYALLSALEPAQANPHRSTNYDHYFTRYGLDKIQYPVTINQIPEIEDQVQVCINVFTFWDDEGRARTPVYISSKPYNKTIDLLYWEAADQVKEPGHYAWIKNFSAFMGDVPAAKGNTLHWCKKCLAHFQSANIFDLHQRYCRGVESSGQVFIMPQPGKSSELSFRNYSNSTRAPLVVYADFEALVVPKEKGATRGHKSHFYEHHEPCTVGYKIKSYIPELDEPYKVIHGPNCVKKFIRKMIKFEKKTLDIYDDDKRMVMTPFDDLDFRDAKICHICHQPFIIEDKVRDHDHFTGQYRGAAHSACNIKYRKTLKIPIFFHNFRGYDAHLITAQLGTFKEHPIKVIGQGMEKYLTLSLGKYLVFKDSLMFLGTSLEQLGKNLRKSGMDKFRTLRAEFPGVSEDQLQLLLGKQVYPYEYMDSWERFEETRLPKRESFYNKLKDQAISDDDYEHAVKVWKAFGCETILDYHHIYLKCMHKTVFHFIVLVFQHYSRYAFMSTI